MYQVVKTRLLAWLLGSAVVSLGASASAAAPEPDTRDSTSSASALGNHQRHVRLDLGMRSQFVKGAGFDPFSEKDALSQVSLAASWTFWTHDALSLAAVAGFDYGGTSADARSSKASLDVARFIVAPEARYHLLRLLVLTAKVGPTLSWESAELAGGLGSPLIKKAWKGGVDATAGVAVELWGYARGTVHRPRLWIAAEGGYGWTAPLELALKPKSAGDVPERLVGPSFSDVSISGPLCRATVAVSFW